MSVLYIFILIILIILLYNRYNELYKYNKFILFLFLSALFVMIVFRATTIGTDYRMYYKLFKETTYQSFLVDFVQPGTIEIGYARLTAFAQYMNNFLIIPAMVFIIGIISIHLLGREFHVNKFTLISFFVFSGLYFQMFTALRQMIALGLAYIGIYLLFKYNKQHILFGFICLLIFIYMAMQFHRTATFAITFFILPYIKYGKITVLISGICTITLLITGLAQHINSFLVKIAPYYSSKYMGSSMSNENSFNDLIIESIPVILQFVFLYDFVSRNNITSKKGKFILSGYLLYLIFFTGLNNNSVRRLQLYTLIFPILYSCLFLDGKFKYENKIKNMMDNRSKLLYLCTWILIYIGKLFITDRFGIVPYRVINLINIFYY